MELDLLEKYLKSDDSKKMLKKIKYICMSYGRDSFEQNFSVHDGDSQIDYHFYNYGVKLPEDATNYLDFVFTEFADDNIDIIDWGAAGNYDPTGYCQLTFLLDFKNNKVKISQSLQFYDTDYNSTEISSDMLPLNVIDTLNEIREKRDSEFMEVSFNGSGDSGYIDAAYDSRGKVFSVPADLEDYLYSAIGNYVGSGWEINEGSQGTFYINLVTKNIEFKYGLNIEGYTNDKLYEFNIDF